MVTVFVLSFALVGKANAIEPRADSMGVPELNIIGTTAYCKFSATFVGEEISATMNLWNGSTLVASWCIVMHWSISYHTSLKLLLMLLANRNSKK